jgi:hypothetical protein
MTVHDALTIAAAITGLHRPISVVLPSTGDTLRVFDSGNGCRRCDLPGSGQFAQHGWMKFMEQNQNNNNAMAKRAREGEKIVHILPLDTEGKHPYSWWGTIINGVLTKHTTYALLPAMQDETSSDDDAPLRIPMMKKRPAGSMSAALAVVAAPTAIAPTAAAAPTAQWPPPPTAQWPPPPTATIARTTHYAKADYINARANSVAGSTVAEAVGMRVLNKDGVEKSYGRADLKYDVMGGVLEIVGHRYAQPAAGRTAKLDTFTPAPSPPPPLPHDVLQQAGVDACSLLTTPLHPPSVHLLYWCFDSSHSTLHPSTSRAAVA